MLQQSRPAKSRLENLANLQHFLESTAKLIAQTRATHQQAFSRNASPHAATSIVIASYAGSLTPAPSFTPKFLRSFEASKTAAETAN